jgi:serine/threonine-protein kinase RsbW
MSQKLSIPETSYITVLARREPEEFVARKRELGEVLQHARSGANGVGRGLLILSAPAEGVSELLRQAYDQLFREQGEVIPFYFALSRNDRTVESAVTRFLQTFLRQVVAFRRDDPHILDSSPEISELAELAAPEDGYWIDRLVAACETDSLLADERSFVRQCLSAPLRAAADGAKCVMIIDDLHHADDLAGSTSFTAELYDIFSRSSIPFVLAGRRRYLLPSTQEGEARLSDTSILNLSKLSETDAGMLIERLAAETAVNINEQTRDLLIQQFDSSPGYLQLFFDAAADEKIAFNSFQNCQQLYTKEILGGRLHRYLDSLLDEITEKPEVQRNLIDVLHESLENQAHATQIEFWRKRIEASDEDFRKLMQGLHLQEFIRLNASVVELTDDTSVSRDYIDARYRLEVKAEPRALVTAETLATFLKRAPHIMTRYYRRYAALALRELLNFFNCQPVPQVLFDYQDFRDRYKGLEDEKINAGIAEEQEKLRLPQIVYTASCVAIYPPIKQVLDEERCSVAFGFENGRYADENEVVWIAAELDSKLEASRELTEFWCDRLEMMALMCNFVRHRIWLITPEGFDAEAAKVLRDRRAYGSSRQQVELLMDQLNAVDLGAKTKVRNNEYEMIVPMGDDTEMISAHAVEEIARRHHFKQAAINQIKTALVEACINAAEHSLSPDRKIHQKFVVEDDRIIITVSNRGISLPVAKAAAASGDLDEESRRGWGLKLIRTLMDEVTFEQVDDGTRITMIKLLQK